MKRTTIVDIARETGTDTGTVSRILAGRAREYQISKQRADLVKRTADKMGYIPNASARAFRTGRFGCAALLMTSYEGSYITADLLFGLDDALAERNMHLVVSKVPLVAPGTKSEIPQVLRTSMVDGMLINYISEPPAYLTSVIEERKIPSVWVNSHREIASVYMDSVAAAQFMTKHLIDLGHTRIDYLDPWKSISYDGDLSRVDREHGYRLAMAAAGLAPREWLGLDSVTHDEIEKLLHSILTLPDRPTGLICYFYHAVPAILHVAAQLGLRIPEDLSVVTFGAEDMGGLWRVSAMVEMTYLLGKNCVELLCEIIDGGHVAPPSRKLLFDWRDHGTAAPVNRLVEP